MPTVPPSLPREVGGALARLAHRLRCTLREADERCSVEDVLDEADVAGYLHDVDNPPADAPAPTRPRR